MKLCCLFLACLNLALFSGRLIADDDDKASQRVAEFEAAKRKLAAPAYDLRYKFSAGESMRWQVVHVGTTETKIRGNTQNSQSRTVSTKVWKVTGVAENGNLTFVHSVADVDMWQKVSDRPEVRYNSKTDEKPPLIYEAVADTVGVPLTSITIDPHGQVIKRESILREANLGFGEITLPLPPEPVKEGDEWFAPGELTVRLEGGQVQRIKIRHRHLLEKVQTGVATIKIQTEVLTPVHDAKVKSQLMQQLTSGHAKFDIDAGRILEKQIDWDETVIGFNGADSIMQYLARFTENLLPDAAVTTEPVDVEKPVDQPAATSAVLPVKARADAPALRR